MLALKLAHTKLCPFKALHSLDNLHYYTIDICTPFTFTTVHNTNTIKLEPMATPTLTGKTTHAKV
jgi:hypothetical protein